MADDKNTKTQEATQTDAELAAKFRKAAEEGDADAQNSLGNLYYNGRGVPAADER
jgi:TPR repeat protein